MSKAVRPSWDRGGIVGDPLHSPNGIKQFREALKYALIRKYVGMAESMWQYDFGDSPQLEDFQLMTLDCEPEKTLMKGGQGVWFPLPTVTGTSSPKPSTAPPSTGQWYFLPVVFNGGINISGNFVSWSPMPIGYVDGTDEGKDAVRDEIRNLKLDATNSVLMRDNLYGVSDYDMIVQSVNALVDTCMTISNLEFLMKAPFVFRCTDSNLNDAKQYYLSLAQDALAIFKYADTDEAQPVVEATGVTFDPGLFDIYRHWENQLLAQLGIPGAQVTQKRTVQTEDEIHLGDDMISLRRQEKFRFRKLAIDRLNKMAGTHVTVTCVIDAQDDNNEREGQDKEAEKNDLQ